MQSYVRPVSAVIAAGHDDTRDADRLITFTRSKRIASDGLIGIEVSPLGFITHLAPCLIRRRTAGASPVLYSGHASRRLVGAALDEKRPYRARDLIRQSDSSNFVRLARQ